MIDILSHPISQLAQPANRSFPKTIQPNTLSVTPTIGTQSALEVMKSEILNNDGSNEDAFFVCDLGEVYRQLIRWETAFPSVKPFFAIKCNPDHEVLKLLASSGTGFDCASKGEIQQVLSLGVDPSRIIYANPCKPMSHIRYAASVDVRRMTFDNADELRKIKLCHPRAQLVLRILTDDSKSMCQFGVKFGAPLSNTYQLLATAHELGLEVIGVSFHVGSGCSDPDSYRDAIHRASIVFDQAKEFGYKMNFLDIGGGFPGADEPGAISLEKISEVVDYSLKKYFPEGGLELISEPGRYFVTSAFTIACNITSRRVVSRDSSDDEGPKGQLNATELSPADHPSYMYYINDGVYGSFNCIMFDHQVIHPKVLMKSGTFFTDYPELEHAFKFESSVWGPTCDSLDVITKKCLLPELDVNDWIYCDNMGAYTSCAASEFNGYSLSRIIYTFTERKAYFNRLNLDIA